MALLSQLSTRGLICSAFVLIGAILTKLFFATSRPANAPPGPPHYHSLAIYIRFRNEIFTFSIKSGVVNVREVAFLLGTSLTYNSREDGPVFFLKLGSQNVVVLASGEVIKRIVDKRSANYSDRPRLFMQDIWEGSRIIMRGYDSLWKVERKLYHQYLNITKASRYVPYQDVETKQLMTDLLTKPSQFEDLITRSTLSVATSMAYGFRVLDPKHPVMQELLVNAHGFFVMVNSSKLLDWYPELRPFFTLLPTWIYPTVKKAKTIFHRERAQFHQLYRNAKSASQQAGSMPSFAADIASAQESWKDEETSKLLTDHVASYVAGIAMEGGADTTSNTLAGLIKAMMLYPDIQKAAQKQLDDVVGRDRLPTMDDFGNLPYIRQVIKEALRWLPTAISGAIPHATRTADEIEVNGRSYTIPAGTTVVIAVWSANNDPDLFPNPRVFDPTRHNPELSFSEAAAAANYRDRGDWTFGAGRRICPGIHVAERTLFLATARLLWTFDIHKAIDDKTGQEIEVVPDEVTQSIAARPVPFPCNITVRSSQHEIVALQEWKEVQNALLDKSGAYLKDVLAR